MKARLLLLVALLPALAAYAILFLQIFSVPYQDDYHAIVAFSNGYQQQSDWKQKLLLVAADQHNEYKLVFEHSIVAIELEFTHHLDFLILAVLGDLALLPIAWLLWKIYPDMGLRAFLPIPFVFFALTDWENLDWAMAGLQNIPVILFSLLSLYLLTRTKDGQLSAARATLACLLGILASLTSANGFLLVPVGLVILLGRRCYLRALAWCLSFVVPFIVYLYRFSSVAHPAIEYAFAARPLFFLAFLGGVAPMPGLAVVVGLGVLAVLVLARRSGFDRTHPAAFYFALWIVLTAAVVGWVRGAAGLAVVSRYGIYSNLLLIFCYAFFTRRLATGSSAVVNHAFYAVTLAMAIAFCVAADMQAWQKLGERRLMVLAGMQHFCADPALNSPMTDPRIMHAAPLEAAYEQRMLTEAIAQGIYIPQCITHPQQR